MIELNNIHIKYNKQTYISYPQLKLHSNQFIGIYGDSGCGKSSFLDALNLEKDFFDYTIDSIHLNSLTEEEKYNYKYNHITYISQNHQFIPALTCYSIIEFALYASNNTSTIEDILNIVHLDHIDSSTTVNQLSGGQQELFALAYAIAKNDPIWLLDEILASLDEETKLEILTLLKEYSQTKTIFLTFHYDDSIPEIMINNLDTILHFENNSIQIEKEFKGKDLEIQADSKKIQFKLLKKAIMHYHSISNLLYVALIVLGVALGLYMYFSSTAASRQLQKLDQLLKHTESTCTLLAENRTDNENYKQYQFGFIGTEYGIEESKIDIISKMDEVKRIVPAPPFQICKSYNFSYEVDTDNENLVDEEMFNFIVDNQQITLHYGDWDTIYITPYISTDLDYVCDRDIYENGNLYISSSMAKQLNITDINHEIKITMNALVPIDSKTNTVIASINGSDDFEFEQQDLTFTKISITATVRGIIDENYPFDTPTDFMLPQELMYSIFEENKIENSQYEIPRYLIELKEGSSYREFSNHLKSTVEGVYVVTEGQSIINGYELIQKTNAGLVKYSYIVAGIVLVLCVIYSLYSYKNDQHFLNILHKSGINNHTTNSLLLFKSLRYLLGTMLFGMISIIGIFFVMSNIQSGNGYIPDDPYIFFVGLFVLFIIGIFTQFISLFKGLIHHG